MFQCVNQNAHNLKKSPCTHISFSYFKKATDQTALLTGPIGGSYCAIVDSAGLLWAQNEANEHGCLGNTPSKATNEHATQQH